MQRRRGLATLRGPLLPLSQPSLAPITLKIDHTPQTVNASSKTGTSPKPLCCFDVSKASLSLYAEYQPEPETGKGATRIEEEISNQTGPIEQLLDRLEDLAEEAGLEGLRVLAEATGGFERKLSQTAQQI